MRNRGRQCGGRGCNRRMGQFLDPALLLLLEQSSAHGYTLLSRLAEFGLEFLAPTVVYRALREMEDQGWVSSTWDDEETQGPPRRIYALTSLGRDVLRCCVAQLHDTRQVIGYFLALHEDLAAERELDVVALAPVTEEIIMKLVIPANGVDLDAPTSPVFGRCQTFIFVNPETLEFEALPNPAAAASAGAGVQAAQLVIQQGAQAVLARSLGPKAFGLIQSAGVTAYVLEGATVREALLAFKS
ncbi:MAG: helix-turn-helix transcriptional regulator, partial [Anaerolineae bacterium]|nr:helix-turn-helix transcriptional regulator [Anaerolineae bacterium]